MKKLGLILIGATLFDLGTVVASSHAAVDFFLKIEGADGVATASCLKQGGAVVTKADGKYCQTKAPATATATGAVLLPNAATKAPAKKEEAKKE